MRKTKETKLEVSKAESKVQEAKKRLNEIEEMARLAEEEERSMIERVENEINELCTSNGLFCGIVLGPHDLGSIVELMSSQKENIKIVYKLYFKED
jgi:hypothetical protein